jgi:hypothetical protein
LRFAAGAVRVRDLTAARRGLRIEVLRATANECVGRIASADRRIGLNFVGFVINGEEIASVRSSR